jgi:very-short-patch-repair endonuclease
VSDAEEALAQQIYLVGLPVPDREYVFAKPRRYRFDFAWPDKMVAVEVEGGRWVGGRHTSPVGFGKDCEKYSEAAARGWRIVRVTPEMIEDGTALGYIERALGGEHE